MRRLWLVVGLWSLLYGGVAPLLVWGHAFPRRSEPQVGASLVTSPPAVRIWFDSVLEAAFSSLRVQTLQGQPATLNKGRVSTTDATLLELALPPLTPGTYRIFWKVLSRDGHPTEGSYAFTVRRP